MLNFAHTGEDIMELRFAREEFTQKLFNEMAPLVEAHYAELAPAGGDNRPRLEPYFALQASGSLRVFTARCGPGHGRLVGYGFFLVVPNPQYNNALHSKQDLFFLRDDCRRGIAGFSFMKWCDEQLAAGGVEFAYRHLNVKNDHESLMTRLGYELHERVYTRRFSPCVQAQK